MKQATTRSAGRWAFIYSITNKNTLRTYIGSTNRKLSARWNEHKKRLRNGDHKNLDLQRDYDIGGLRLFTFHLVERCELEDAEVREQFWRDHFASLPGNVYNTGSDVATPFKGRIHSEETKKRIRKSVSNTLRRKKKLDQD